MGCSQGKSTEVKEGGAAAGQPAQPASAGESEAKKVIGNIQVYGATVSMNCMGCVMLAVQEKCGELVPTQPPEGTTTPAFLKINPFHGVPAIKDGDLCLGESNAILRYMGGKYVQALYLGFEAQRRSYIDWSMDRFASTLYPDVVATIYPVMGFMGPPADKGAAAEKAMKNLNKFAEVFLKEKFIGGKVLSIADYKAAPFFYAYAHPQVKAQSGVELPERILQFNLDFQAACPQGAEMLAKAGGFGLQEFLDGKTNNKEPMIVAKEGFKDATVVEEAGKAILDFLSSFTIGGKDAVKIYGVTVSMNCVGPILFGRHTKCGDMEVVMPGEQSQAPEYLKMVPFGGVPGMKDGEWTMGESSAILRHLARSYAEEYYPKDPVKRAHIDWAMDRFSFGMYNEVVATIYVAMGFSEAPADVEFMKQKGKHASEGMKEFADFFLKNKFIGGDVLSVADFKVAPFFVAYAHPRLKEKCFVEVPERIVKFNQDFAEACPAAEMFRKAEGGFSIVEMLDAKSRGESGGTKTQAEIDLQEAMTQEAAKTVLAPEELGPNIEAAGSPPVCGCFGA